MDKGKEESLPLIDAIVELLKNSEKFYEVYIKGKITNIKIVKLKENE